MTEALFVLGEQRIADLRQRRLGVIVPASNTNAEPDCLAALAAGLDAACHPQWRL